MKNITLFLTTLLTLFTLSCSKEEEAPIKLVKVEILDAQDSATGHFLFVPFENERDSSLAGINDTIEIRRAIARKRGYNDRPWNIVILGTESVSLETIAKKDTTGNLEWSPGKGILTKKADRQFILQFARAVIR